MANTATNGFDSLPQEWKVVRLGDVAKLSSGGTPSKKRDDFWEGEIPWASPKDMKTPWLYDTQDHISQEGLDDGSRLVPAKSLFIVIRGMILAKDLPVSMTMVPMAFNQDMKAIRPTDQLDPEFLLHVFSAFKAQLLPEIGTSAHGTRRIGTQAVEDFQVPLPTLEEQRAIAGVLRTVQRVKDTTEKVVAAARQLKQSLMRHLFTYGPVPFHEADQIELQEADIGELPTCWETTTIGDVAQLTQYGISKRGESAGAYPILRMSNLAGGRVDFSSLQYVDLDDDEFAKFEVHQGDILFNRTNSFELVGKTSLFESDTSCVFASYLIRVTLDVGQVEPAFVNYYMNDDLTQRRLKTLASRAVSQSNINATKLKGFAIPRPERATQSGIADQINSLDEKIRREEKRRAAIEELFNSLLHELMTGQRRVHELGLEFPDKEAA